MPDAAEQMMQQRPGVAEHDQPADEARGEGLHIGVSRRARGRRDQPPGQKQRAEIQRHAGDAMDDGKRHRQRPAVGLQMWRKRSFDPGGHWRLRVADPETFGDSGAVGDRGDSSLIYGVESPSATTNISHSEPAFTSTDGGLQMQALTAVAALLIAGIPEARFKNGLFGIRKRPRKHHDDRRARREGAG